MSITKRLFEEDHDSHVDYHADCPACRSKRTQDDNYAKLATSMLEVKGDYWKRWGDYEAEML